MYEARQNKEKVSRILPYLKKKNVKQSVNKGSEVLLQRQLICSEHQKDIDNLFQKIKSKVGENDRIVDMVNKKDIEVIYLEKISERDYGGAYDPATDKIYLYSKDTLIVHENRNRLFNCINEDADYKNLNSVTVKAPFGKLSFETILYHELGHYYQHHYLLRQKADEFKGFLSSNSGKFLLELHNILQSEHKIAKMNNEALRSSYRTLEYTPREGENIEYYKKYKFSKDSITESPNNEETNFLSRDAVVSWVNTYIDSIKEYGFNQCTKKIDNVILLLNDIQNNIELSVSKSKVSLIQNILDSAYFYLKEQLGDKNQ